MPERSMPSQLTEGFNRFHKDLFARQHDLYEALADKGQKPHSLVIACSDSRVDPSQVFDARPGELFVVRNVANLVPSCEMDGAQHGVSAALEFAVKYLQVPNILILGHRQCGGVEACVRGGVGGGSMFVDHWIEQINDAAADARKQVSDDVDTDVISERTELCSIQHSLQRLMTYPFVRERVEAGNLKVHGARFSIADGELQWLTVDGDFQNVVHP